MTDQATNQKPNPVSEKLALVSNQWRSYSISITTIGTEFIQIAGRQKVSRSDFIEFCKSEDSHYEMRDETIKIYLKLKQLMYEIDDIDESSDEEGNKPPKRELLISGSVSDSVDSWSFILRVPSLALSSLGFMVFRPNAFHRYFYLSRSYLESRK